MKLQLKQKFTLEIGDDEVIEGFVGELTKSQQKDAQVLADKYKKEIKALQKLKKEFDRADENDYEVKDSVEDKIEKLNEKVMGMNPDEEVSKFRFEKSVESEHIDRLKEICETYGYSLVMKTILQDISEKKGNDKKS